jgi:tetratricopeptide (TPR) repeat protein
MRGGTVAFLGAAFLAGLLAGAGLVLWYQREAPTPAQEAVTGGMRQSAPRLRERSLLDAKGLPGTRGAVPTRQSNSDQVLALLRDGRIEAGLNALEQFEKSLDPRAHAALREEVLAEIRRWMEHGRLDEAQRLSRAYQDRYLHDAGLLGVLAEIYLQLGRTEDALLSLFEILDYPPSVAVAQTTRDRILTVQRTHAAGLSQRREFQELVEFYALLLSLDPNNDRYRLAQAEWLAEVGELEQAEALLGDVGTARSDEAANLRARLDLIRSGIAVERQGDRLIAEVMISDQPIRMLVDTGATMSSLSLSVLRRLGARRTGRSAAVVTASGVITAPVFVVDEVVVGDRTFPDHPVLGLDLEDAGVAGLLGMDVLGTTGLPRL